jgi:hypothetical protein
MCRKTGGKKKNKEVAVATKVVLDRVVLSSKFPPIHQNFSHTKPPTAPYIGHFFHAFLLWLNFSIIPFKISKYFNLRLQLD